MLYFALFSAFGHRLGNCFRVFFSVSVFLLFFCFFLLLFLCFSVFVAFVAFLLLLFFCFCCFSAFVASLPFCFSAFVASLPFCFSAFVAFLLLLFFCFSVFVASLLETFRLPDSIYSSLHVRINLVTLLPPLPPVFLNFNSKLALASYKFMRRMSTPQHVRKEPTIFGFQQKFYRVKRRMFCRNTPTARCNLQLLTRKNESCHAALGGGAAP